MALTRVRLVSHNPDSLALFYQTALGFSRVGPGTPDLLRYGDSEIELVAFDPPGQTFPAAQRASDLSFQHFAMIVPDIAASYDALRGMVGWRPISMDGPVLLPARSGGVTAYKFRDPEGHPLEFLQPPAPAPARIDHTAIVVADTAASAAFYAGLGLTVQVRTLNQGAEQAALDGLDAPVVEVTRLGDAAGHLHLELLCYRGAGKPAVTDEHDVAATRLVFNTAGPSGLIKDPDGHFICLERTCITT
jgi:catechol 2,3-dioxygenase-like lactoylglutathione lyase family enzyme